MRNGKGMRWLALAASLLVAACSDAGSPVEPSGAQLASVQATTNRARHEELQQAREEQKAYFKQMKEANRENLRAAREEWKAWKADWKEQYKLQKEQWKREHPGEKGGPEIQLLRCEPRDYEAAAEIIGPQGGTIKVGEHQLVIPAGALAQEELIVAEAPTSSLVDVNFGPHGQLPVIPGPARLPLGAGPAGEPGQTAPAGIDRVEVALLVHVGQEGDLAVDRGHQDRGRELGRRSRSIGVAGRSGGLVAGVDQECEDAKGEDPGQPGAEAPERWESAERAIHRGLPGT